MEVLRGRDTQRGEAGYCPECEQFVPDGPDACIGSIDGVLRACCGHGGLSQPNVVFVRDGLPFELRDEDALAFFAEQLS